MQSDVNLRAAQKVDRPGLLGRLISVLLPHQCLLCQLPCEEQDLCVACKREMPKLQTCCPRCAQPLGASNALCLNCLCKPPPFLQCRAAYQYGNGIEQLIPRLKFHADLAAGRVLSELLLEQARDWERPEAIVPIPLHYRRLRQRGFDQALELAKPVAKRLRISLRSDLLIRWQHTQAQSELDRTQRQKNVRNAFCCETPRALPSHIALLDDVMTTGATARAAAQILIDVGVKRVDVWVVARVP